jgi:hypothetical protein
MLARVPFAMLLGAASGGAWAQTIQLPSFSNVGVNTTVIVPDSGGASLGGDRRASSSWTSFGAFPRSQGWGVRRQTSGIGVTAQIHDPQAAAAAGRNTQSGAARPLMVGARRAAGDAPPGSVAELEKRRQRLAADAQNEALRLLDKARAAHTAGKPSVANIYYGMAARHASGELRNSIVAEHNRLADQNESRESLRQNCN